ncbi:MAG: nucleotidyltransferase domain-containing protein [Nitrospirae bacterium]|nr:MAG: nucleotidyltransferase domain-containing protein [Nitrospirota bacterium]
MKPVELVPEVAVKRATETLKEALKGILQSNLVKIVLFGSRSGGPVLPDSDVDIFVVVEHKDSAVTDKVFSVAEEIEERYFLGGYSFSIHLYDLRTFQALKEAGSLLVKDIESHGTVVYERKAQS